MIQLGGLVIRDISIYGDTNIAEDFVDKKIDTIKKNL